MILMILPINLLEIIIKYMVSLKIYSLYDYFPLKRKNKFFFFMKRNFTNNKR